MATFFKKGRELEEETRLAVKTLLELMAQDGYENPYPMTDSELPFDPLGGQELDPIPFCPAEDIENKAETSGDSDTDSFITVKSEDVFDDSFRGQLLGDEHMTVDGQQSTVTPPAQGELPALAQPGVSQTVVHQLQDRQTPTQTARPLGLSLDPEEKEEKKTQESDGDKNHECTVCNKKFRSRKNYNQHMRIHTSKKQFSCKFCQRSFLQKGNMQTHLRIHTGDKPFKCTHCTKSFSQSSTLNHHTSIHTGEKPFACQLCGKVFSRKSSVSRHAATCKYNSA